MAKDLGYAVEDALRNGLELETASAALDVFKRAIERGHGNQDMSAVITATRSAVA
jgi:3-hydroxyisobutyrate dehydrogenase-like beta-hydroxyacid dehydrogenase